MLEPVERRLARRRRAARPACPELAHDRGQHRVVAQGVVVDQVLVTQRQGEHALADQGGQAVLDLIRRAVIDETGREPPDQADRPIGGAQEQRAGVGGDRPAIESGHHGTALDACKVEPIRATVCRHRGTPLLGPKALLQKNFLLIPSPDAPTSGEKSRLGPVRPGRTCSTNPGAHRPWARLRRRRGRKASTAPAGSWRSGRARCRRWRPRWPPRGCVHHAWPHTARRRCGRPSRRRIRPAGSRSRRWTG